MARPSDEDSGVLFLQELAPRYTSSSVPQRPAEPPSPFWTSQMPVAAPPYGQAPPTWSGGQWSPPLQQIEPPHYTPRPLGMGMRRPRRWGLRFIMFFGLCGLGAFLARDHLPRFPRSISEAATTWDALSTSVLRAKARLTGKPLPPSKAAPAAPATHAARGPEIVPMPSPGGAPAPAPVAAAAPSPRPAAPAAAAAPAEPAPRPARVMTAPRPLQRLAAAAPRPRGKKNNDPFESDDAAAVALGKTLKTPATVAAREATAPEPKAAPAPREDPPRAERPAPEPKAPKGPANPLEDLMSSSLKHPAKAGKELDRRLAGVGETREADPVRKKAETEAPAAHALSRTEIQTAMNGLKEKMHGCSQQFQQTGPADVKVTVTEAGSVGAVVVSGQFAGTPTGACVEKAVKGVSFPASSGLRFDYRLSLR